MVPDSPMPGPYAGAAGVYWSAGWRGVLPLPPGQKYPPPKNWTGQGAPWPSFPDVAAWSEGAEGDGNIALRLPEHVLGIDVDDYDGKAGGATLTGLAGRFGPLPPTWTVGSREGGVSGIRLFRIPVGRAWPGVLGPGIELVQYRHRYAVVWPSIHPDTGRTYTWTRPDGLIAVGEVPHVDDIPDLPPLWITGVTGGEAERHRSSLDLDPATCGAWLQAVGAGQECRAISRATDRALADLAGGVAARHDVGMNATARLTLLASEGHPGAVSALNRFGQAWSAAVVADRGPAATRSEWERLIYGAVQLAAARPETLRDHGDPCISPLHGGSSGLGTAVMGPLVPPQRTGAPLAPPVFPAARPPIPITVPAPGARPGWLPPQEALPPPLMPGQAASAPRPDPTSWGAPPPELAAVPDPSDAEPERRRSSWAPVDLGPVLEGNGPPPAVLLRRNDGACAWYAGAVNGLIGESESGKTWIAMAGCAQVLAEGGSIVYLDFEDSASGWVARMRALGVDMAEAVATGQVAYCAPDEGMTPEAVMDLGETMATFAPTLAVVDGVNAAMTLMGLDINSNNDATRFAQVLLKPLAKTGAAVVYVDHIPKGGGDSKGGIGAQAKRAMTTGCCLMVEVIKPFGRGISGRLKLMVDKDRPGHVRGASYGAKKFGLAYIDPQPDTEMVTVRIDADGAQAPGTAAEDVPERSAWRPTHLMQAVSWFLSGQLSPVTKNRIVGAVKGKRTYVLRAIDLLIEEGYIVAEASGFRSARPFSESGDASDESGPTDE